MKHRPRPAEQDDRLRSKDNMPALRPLFAAPEAWTPAPDGSIASAIIRSLAYAEGPERLDEKFIAAVNKHVACFRDMKEELARGFHAALIQKGYAND